MMCLLCTTTYAYSIHNLSIRLTSAKFLNLYRSKNDVDDKKEADQTRSVHEK